MKKYLITGGAGFIGSHLVEGLLNRGDFVTVIDDLSTGTWNNIAQFESNLNFRAIIASADERSLIEREVPKHNFVYHLASAVGVKLIIDRPVETVQRIVRTTDSLVDVCMRYRVPLLLTSTSEVYGKSDCVPFAEDNDITIGATSKRRWAYASAKMLDEFLVLAHHYQTSLPVFIVRLFNTVGPKQTGQYGMVIPRFINAAIKNEPLEVYGDGKQQRCFCSVFDVIEALLKFESSPQASGQVINIGSNEEISIGQLAEKIIKIVKSKSKLKFISYEEAYGHGFDDMRRRIPDLNKAKRILNWQPKTKLDEIINQIYQYNINQKNHNQ
ncbi:MAG: GDP-mannose 4,6-dehydratase [Planctomycetaceae bacterium]|jgi:UDP-glucose 4-epimerase|nr:GDP-mannose 4,6-dehydratase [Planctomycetaceae bacterium]